MGGPDHATLIHMSLAAKPAYRYFKRTRKKRFAEL